MRQNFRNYHNEPSRDVQLLEDYPLRQIDKQADDVIERVAAQVSIATTLGSGLIDPIVVTWQSIVLVDRIAQLYAVRPGLIGTMVIIKRSLAMIVFAEIAEETTMVLQEALGGAILGKIGGRTSQGLANGFFMLRLGNRIRSECRPIRNDDLGAKAVSGLTKGFLSHFQAKSTKSTRS